MLQRRLLDFRRYVICADGSLECLSLSPRVIPTSARTHYPVVGAGVLELTLITCAVYCVFFYVCVKCCYQG